jgi:hypothetical protein
MIKEVFTVGTDVREKPRWDGTIFLAGPIERVAAGEVAKLPRWRDDAVLILEQRPEKLVIYNPQWSALPKDWTYDAQVAWEVMAMNHARVRLFWLARVMPDLPGFTTNIEVGEHLTDEDAVFGAPPDAPHTRYVRTRLKLLADQSFAPPRPWFIDLKACCDMAVRMLPGSGLKPLVARFDAEGRNV